MIEHLRKLSPETIEMFRRTRNEVALNIPPELALYITQLDDATRLLKQYHTMSECARQLQLIYPELSVSTCKNRLYDSINYMNDQCTVTEGAWLLFYADMMMSLYEICLSNCLYQPVDTDDDTHAKPLDNVPAVKEARLCLEKALEYRLRASSNAIDPDRIRFRHQIVSADMELARMGVKKQGLLSAYKKALDIVKDTDTTDIEKQRLIDEIERELNVTDIPHEEVRN